MKLSSDASVLRLSHEGITKLASLSDFDNKNIKQFPNICKKSIHTIDADASNDIGSETTVSGANTSFISVRRLIDAVNTIKHYGHVARVIN